MERDRAVGVLFADQITVRIPDKRVARAVGVGNARAAAQRIVTVADGVAVAVGGGEQPSVAAAPSGLLGDVLREIRQTVAVEVSHGQGAAAQQIVSEGAFVFLRIELRRHAAQRIKLTGLIVADVVRGADAAVERIENIRDGEHLRRPAEIRRVRLCGLRDVARTIPQTGHDGFVAGHANRDDAACRVVIEGRRPPEIVGDAGALAVGRVGEHGGVFAIANECLRGQVVERIPRAPAAVQPVVFVTRFGEADVVRRTGHVVGFAEVADDFQVVVRVVVERGDVAHRVGDLCEAGRVRRKVVNHPCFCF